MHFLAILRLVEFSLKSQMTTCIIYITNCILNSVVTLLHTFGVYLLSTPLVQFSFFPSVYVYQVSNWPSLSSLVCSTFSLPHPQNTLMSLIFTCFQFEFLMMKI